jgi:hypothetical protein
MTIWKYEITPGRTVIKMPVGAKILWNQTLRAVPSIWVQVDPMNDTEERIFIVVPTGGRIPDNTQYIGTFIVQECLSPLVFHLFEETA